MTKRGKIGTDLSSVKRQSCRKLARIWNLNIKCLSDSIFNAPPAYNKKNQVVFDHETNVAKVNGHDKSVISHANNFIAYLASST